MKLVRAVRPRLLQLLRPLRPLRVTERAGLCGSGDAQTGTGVDLSLPTIDDVLAGVYATLPRTRVGVELPIPGPGNLPLPIIFGTVQEFIDWVKGIGAGVDPSKPGEVLGEIQRVIGDVFTTAKDAFERAVKGATAGQAQRYEDFVRDMIKAGTFDPGAILNAARDQLPDIFAPPSGAPAPLLPLLLSRLLPVPRMPTTTTGR